MPWEVSPVLRTQIAVWSDKSGEGVGNGGFPSTEGESVQSVNELYEISGEAEEAEKVSTLIFKK